MFLRSYREAKRKMSQKMAYLKHVTFGGEGSAMDLRNAPKVKKMTEQAMFVV